MRPFKPSLLFTLSLALGVPSVATLQAQSPDGKAAEAGARAAAPDSAEAPAAEESFELPGQQVIGQRRKISAATKVSTPLIDIPMAVQVVPREILEKQQVRELSDALRNVSGVYSPGTYSGGYTYFFLRGWWASNVGNYRRNGMQIWHLGHPYASNVERVEVLKGPSSVLYGDLEPGGAINLVTKKPQFAPSQRFQLQSGSYGLYRGEIDITGPLAQNRELAYRLNASYEQADSWRDVVNHKNIFVSPALSWSISDRLDWTLEAEYKKDDRVGDPGFYTPNNTLAELKAIPLNRFYGEPNGTYDYEDKTALSTLEYRLPGGFSLRNTLSAMHTSRTPFNIYLLGLDSAGRLRREQYFYHQYNYHQFGALDLIGDFRTGPVKHSLLVGADFQRDRNRAPRSAERTLDSTMDYENPEYGRADLRFPVDDPDPYVSELDKYGVYAQDQLSFLEGRIHWLAGLRFNAIDNRRNSNDEVDISPRTGLVYKPAEWLSTFASYSRSFQPNFGDELSGELTPTYSRQFEGGVKADLLDRRLSATVTGYSLTKDDIVNSIERGEDWVQVQGGTQRSNGWELDVMGRPVAGMNLAASYGWTDAYVVEDPNYASGNALPFPEHTASFWLDYDLPLPVRGLNLGGGAFYRGEYFSDESNAVRVPDALTFDATLGYTLGVGRGSHRLQIGVKNLLDERVYNNSWNTWEFGRPRTWQAAITSNL